MATKPTKKFKEQKIWIFFEMNESDLSATLRAVALDKEAKERFEIALMFEMESRNKPKKPKIWWMVEENIANHLYGAEMYVASRTAMRNSKYRVGNREMDGD